MNFVTGFIFGWIACRIFECFILPVTKNAYAAWLKDRKSV